MNVYEVGRLTKMLAENDYPGRGIVLGITPDGKKSVAIYFIMGRSVNSRNRVFVEEPDGIRTQAHDPKLMQDPHLIIYHPVRETGSGLIVTNGDQTDTIRDFLGRGESWEAALRTRCFEDDGPNWTPRISGLLAKDGSYKLSILKAADANGTACVRNFYEYPAEHMVKRHYGVRTERYKLIHFYNDIDSWELFDLQEDIEEMHNLYGKPGYEEITKELKAELKNLQEKYDDPIREVYPL